VARRGVPNPVKNEKRVGEKVSWEVRIYYTVKMKTNSGHKDV